jgi:transcriptional regulator with XRE-family HTH domain
MVCIGKLDIRVGPTVPVVYLSARSRQRYDLAMANSDLRSHLKTLRKRLDPHTENLGEYRRLTYKCGRAVSQEELAEAVGVSRAWYALLESGGTAARPSVPLLNRLADALQTTPEERSALFMLAIPGLRDRLLCHSCGHAV